MASFKNYKGTIFFYGGGDELLKERTYFTKQGARDILKHCLKEVPECTHYHIVPNLSSAGKYRWGVRKKEELEKGKSEMIRPPAEYSNRKSLYEE